MEQEAETAPAASPEEPGAELERDTLEMRAEKLTELHVHPAHERERHHEVLAELPVRGPGRAFLARLEGQRVDEHRTTRLELDVVGAGVAQGDAADEGALLDVERQECCVAQLAEAPLIRVGNEPDGLGPEHGRGVIGGRQLKGDSLVGHEEALPGQLVVEARGGDGFEFVLEDPVDLSVQDARAGEDEAARVAERAV